MSWWYHFSLVKPWPKLDLFLNFWVRWGNKFYFGTKPVWFGFSFTCNQKKSNHYNSAFKKMPRSFFPDSKKFWNYFSLNILLQNYGVLQNLKHLKSKKNGISLEIIKWLSMESYSIFQSVLNYGIKFTAVCSSVTRMQRSLLFGPWQTYIYFSFEIARMLLSNYFIEK